MYFTAQCTLAKFQVKGVIKRTRHLLAEQIFGACTFLFSGIVTNSAVFQVNCLYGFSQDYVWCMEPLSVVMCIRFTLVKNIRSNHY